MKIRLAFVSNSSSSSFTLAKAYMNKTQIKEFKKFIDDDDQVRLKYIQCLVECGTNQEEAERFIDDYEMPYCSEEGNYFTTYQVERGEEVVFIEKAKELGIDPNNILTGE